ncbi:3-oxoacyl-ACP reductase FabG [Euzebya rosea]|uniref:3-oxoacyl-ACP reductase FabG n=1 Tax=Euzebya rosea TaxID=2052804 RepID=UPI000D3E9288|nr:3-oxoacyl-ACP reductase FabG [Euzebya rosea]
MTDQPTDDRTWALVTGASKGIGAATAVALARQGRNVLVGYGGDADGAAAVVTACEDAGVTARAVQADLSTSIDPLAEAAEDVGGVAVLVNNAGITADGLVFGMDDDAFARVLDVNLTASFRLSRAVLRRMLRARFGRIVNVTSVVGLHGNAGQANYAASKAGLVGLTKSLAREVGKRNITVNAVAPGFISTAMTDDVDTSDMLDRIPAGRLGEAEEIAAAIAFLCSDEAAYVNGTVLQVDGGLFA